MNWNTPINKNARLKLSKIFRCVDLDQPIGLYFRLSIFSTKTFGPHPYCIQFDTLVKRKHVISIRQKIDVSNILYRYNNDNSWLVVLG